MRKDRNAFFEQQAYNSTYYPTPNMNMAYNMPSTINTSSQSFVAGPNVYDQNNDLESRLAKIERQINRLDNRITKLESNNTLSSTDTYSDNTNMYMV